MNQTSKTIGKLLKYAGPFRITILLSAIFAAFSAVINLKSYLCVYEVAKLLIQTVGNFGAINLAAMKELGFRAVYYVCMGFGMYGMSLLCSHICAYHTVARIRIRLIRRLGTLSIGYHTLHPSGKQRKIIEKNTDNLEILIAHNIPDYVQSLVLPVAFLVFMFQYDWRLSLICLAPIVIGFGLLFSMLKGESSDFIGKVQKSGEDIGNAATEYVRGIAVVKTFGQTASSFRRYKKAVKDYADFMTKYSFSMENSFSLYTTIVNAVFLFLIPGGILLYNFGGGTEKTIMTFSFFAVLIPLVASILTKLMHSSSNLMLADASFVAIDNILNEKPLPERQKLNVPENTEISLNDVSFWYEEGVKAIDHISMTIKPGTVTALVGESGGGKSTVANLIARFWDVSDGSVTVGGVDVRDLDYSNLMKHISVVFQDTNLFTETIMENIRYGRLDATDEECIAAARLANADGFIRRLPEGYNTVLHSGGANLSQGQRQLLAIARAAVADPPVLILDEATSSIDTRTEKLVQKGMDALMSGRTSFVIAHRLSTVRNADCIMVMEQGRIIERGTHEQLMDEKGRYYQLYTGKSISA